jgi:hypothetical protein
MKQSQKRKSDQSAGGTPKKQKTANQSRGLMTVAAPATTSDRVKPYFEVSKRPGLGPDGITALGCDYIGPVYAPASNEVAGTPILNFDFGPIELGRSRLNLFAQMYERWHARRLRFHYVPGVPTSQKGSLLLAFDRDVSDPTPPASADGLRQYMAMEASAAAPIWCPQSIDVRPNNKDLLYTNSVAGLGPGQVNYDPRLNYCGTAYAVIVAPTGAAALSALGDIYVEYEIDFTDACLDNQTPTYKAQSSADKVNSAAADFLAGYVGGVAGQTVSNPSNTLLTPFIPAGGTVGQVGLSEGIWRLVGDIQQNQAGAVSIGAPVLVANNPAAAPAPQVSTYNIENGASTVSGDWAFIDYMLGVPPGGAKLSVPMSITNGVAGTGAPGTFTLERIRPVLGTASLSTVF